MKFALIVCAVTALALPAWADDMDNMQMGGAQHHKDASFAFGAPAKAAEATRTVAITMNEISYTPAAVTVRKGEVVRFVLTNTAGGDHEFVLGDTATQLEHRKEMPAMMHGGMSMDHDEANAITVHRGQTRELVWRFTQAGTLEFDCNIPGHYEAGMHGVITVE